MFWFAHPGQPFVASFGVTERKPVPLFGNSVSKLPAAAKDVPAKARVATKANLRIFLISVLII